MRMGGIHSGGKRRWTPAWSFVPRGSGKHLTEDTYTTAGESCDRNLELFSVNPMERKYNQLCSVLGEKRR